MLRKSTFKRLAAIGLASAMVVPAGAAAQPTDIHGQAVAAGGGPGITTQDLRAPDQVSPPVVGQDMRAPDQVAGPGPAHVAGTVGHAQPTTSDDGLDTAVYIALGGLALVGSLGIGLLIRARARTARQAA
jgi:hypothetical protein